MASNAGAIKAGRAYVEIYGDKSPLMKTLGDVKKGLAGWGESLAGIGMAAGAGLATVGAAVGGVAASFANFGSALADASARTGASVESLSTFQYAAEQTGASLEDVEAGFRGLAKSGAFAGMSADDAFRAALQQVAAISDPMEKSRVAMELFGKSGIKLIPMASDMKALEASAKGLGAVMSSDAAAAADRLGDAWGDLMTAGRSVVNMLGEAMAPVLTEAIELVTDFASVLMNGGILEAGKLVWSGLSAMVAESMAFWLDATKGGLTAVAGFMIDVFSTIQTAWVETTEFMAKMWNKATNKIASGIIEIMGWFDKSLDVADAQANLDEDTARRQEGFDKRRDDRLKQVQDSADKWKAGAAEGIEGFAGSVAEQAKAQMDEFRKSIDEVRQKRKGGKVVPPAAGASDEMDVPSIGNLSTVGTFQGSLAGGLGAGNRLDEIATASKQTATNTKQLTKQRTGVGIT